jgi:hypothetical protein
MFWLSYARDVSTAWRSIGATAFGDKPTSIGIASKPFQAILNSVQMVFEGVAVRVCLLCSLRA